VDINNHLIKTDPTDPTYLFTTNNLKDTLNRLIKEPALVTILNTNGSLPVGDDPNNDPSTLAGGQAMLNNKQALNNLFNMGLVLTTPGSAITAQANLNAAVKLWYQNSRIETHLSHGLLRA